MAQITGFGHVSFTVMDMDKTLEFYVGLLGGKVLQTSVDEGPNLGTYVMGKDAQEYGKLRIAVVELAGIEIEFIQYLDPQTKPYHGNPSVAGSAHLAFQVDDLDGMCEKLKGANITFHSGINNCVRHGVTLFRWVYMRDPDGICCEFIQP